MSTPVNNDYHPRRSFDPTAPAVEPVPAPTPQPLPGPEMTPPPVAAIIAPETAPAATTAPASPAVDLSTLPPPVPPAPAPEATSFSSQPVNNGRVNFLHVVKSEWIKLFTLRSTWWVLGATLVVTVGFGIMMMVSIRSVINVPVDTAQMGDILPGNTLRASIAAQMIVFTQVILGVLGVLFITNEYSSGQIRSTLTAVPTRWPVLAAKTLIIAVVGYVITFVAGYGAILASWPFVSNLGSSGELPANWQLIDDRFAPETLKMMAGMALATALVVVFALGVGALVRNTAAGIAIVVVLLFILPSVISLLHWDWVVTAQNYLLTNCQLGLFPLPGTDASLNGTFSFLKSLWVTALWAVVPTVGAGVLLKTRDA